MDFWALLVLSFLTALTGALSPGPLFTFTIEKSLACGRRGWSVGFLAILGHAAAVNAFAVAAVDADLAKVGDPRRVSWSPGVEIGIEL